MVDDRFAIENAHLIVRRIKIVIPIFQEFGRGAVCIDANVVLLMNLGDFDARFAFLTPISVLVRLGEIIFTALLLPTRRKTPGVSSTSAFPFSVVIDWPGSKMASPIDFEFTG